jgi:hypothetical protein
MTAIPIAIPLPRIILAMRSDGSLEILADRPCKVFLTGGLAGNGHIELPPPRVGWAVVTAALEEAAKFERVARCTEGAAPCDQEHG